MARIYAKREDNGEPVLVAISCDSCGVEIKPHPEIADSGWMKYGSDNGPGTDKFECYRCPKCVVHR